MKTSDYSDWINPFLVKELRQSLHAPGFAIIMVWTHLSMACLVAFQAIIGTAFDAHATPWIMIDAVLVLHIIFPFRRTFGHDGDVDELNAELIRLTTMDAPRIAVQKWLSVGSQFILVAISLPPYGAARYFIGGVDIVQDALWFVWLVVNGLVFCVFGLFLGTLSFWAKTILTPCAVVGSIIIDGMSAATLQSAPKASSDTIAAAIATAFVYFLLVVIALGFLGLRYEPPSRMIDDSESQEGNLDHLSIEA